MIDATARGHAWWSLAPLERLAVRGEAGSALSAVRVVRSGR
jgi:hypothetical protein